MIIRIGHYTKTEPTTVVADNYDSALLSTREHLVKILLDPDVDRIWVRKGAYDVIYLKGNKKKPTVQTSGAKKGASNAKSKHQEAD